MTVKKLLLAFVALLGLSWGASAQVSSYGFTALSGTFDTISGGTHVSSIEGDTKTSSRLPIGFSFEFEGVSYDSVKAMSDGFLSFNPSGTSYFTNDLDNASSSRKPLVAPLWDDLDGSATGSYASYKTTGTAPNRVFTFEWKKWEWRYNANTPVITFQAKLFETSNVVEFHYKPEAGSVSSGSASIGMTGASTFLSLDGSGTAPSASSTTETTSINVKPANGQIYRFTPPTCLVPTALAATGITTTTANLGWTSAGASSYEVEVVTSAGSPTGSGTVTSSNPYNATSLTPGTDYKFYVRKICAAGDSSNWAGPFNFTTPPTCLVPTALTATGITTTTANLGWTSAGSSSYEVEIVAASGTPTGAGTVTSSNPYNATSLSPNSFYKFYVRKICTAGDSSNWAGPFNFNTKFVAPYTENFESLSDGDNGVLSNAWKATPSSGYRWEANDGGTTSTGTGPTGDHTTGSGIYIYTEATNGSSGSVAYLESPSIDVTPLTTPEINFWYHRYGDDFKTGYIEVDTNGTWFVVDSIVGQTQTSNAAAYKKKTIYLVGAGYTGDIKVRFKSEKDDYEGDWAIDDFSIVEAPTCLPPTSLTASNITATTAGLGWTSAGASSYEVEVVAASGTPTGSGTVTSSNPYTATSLTAGTLYKYYVRKICSAGDSSSWVGPFNFSTAYQAPYTENFESLSDGDKGTFSNGWSGAPDNGYAWEVNVGTTPTGSTGPDADHTTGSGKYVYTEASNGSNGNTAYLTSPFVDISGLTTPKMEFWYHRHGDDFDTGYIEMDTNGTWFVIDSIIGETQSDNNIPYLKREISLSGYTGIVRARFVSKKDGTSGDWAIDDFVIKETPALDMSATALTRPALGCYTSSDTVTVEVKNVGAQTINFATNNLNVGVLVSNAVTQTLTTQVTTGTLAAGATMTVNVSNSFNMSTAGTYDFKAYINVTGDPDATNDTASSVSRTVIPLGTIPSSVDFTSFSSTNLNTLFPDWREAKGVTPLGTAALWNGSSTSQTNGFGTKTAKVNLYTNNRKEWIVGPKFVPAANDSVYFKLGITSYNSFTPDDMGSDDRFDVMLSADCGNSWTSIKTFNQANTTNLDTVLKQFSVSLDSWVGQEVIVAFFATDGTVNDSEDYDLHLDDIYLGRLVANDLMVDTILEPNAAHCQKDSVSVKVVVKNEGQSAQSNFDVKVDFTGGAISSLTKTIAGPLAAGAADTIVVGKVLASWAVPLNMKAYTSFAADQIHANDSATKSITINSIPGVNLADDTICTGETVTLDAGAGNTYVWSTGATSQTITVNTPGVVHVTVTNTAGCQAIDSAKITQFAVPTVDLGNDTSYCAGTAFSLTLDATNAGATYKWNDNSTGATLNVTTQGTYFVEAKVGNNCSAKDTIVITEEALPIVNLGNDTTIRDGSPFTVDAGAGFKSYKWQDNSTKQTYKATTTQTVIVEVENNAGCKAKDTIEVTIWPVGVEEVTEAQFQLFPNPNRGEFNIVNGGEASTISIEVINIGGQLVHTEKAQVVTGAQYQMDVTSLAKGLYFINVKTGDKTQQFKMIIE